MKDHEAKRKVSSIISKRKITKNDVDELVDVTLEVEAIVELKERMQHLMEEGVEITNKLARSKTEATLERLLSFMLEDL
jgi:geranylgeranyl pyrophosphate synthase